MNRRIRNLFLLRVAGEGQPGAGDNPPPNPGGSGGGNDGGSGDEGQMIPIAELHAKNRENKNLRDRMKKAEEDAKALKDTVTKNESVLQRLFGHLGISSVEELDGLEPPNPPPARPNPPARPGRTADQIQSDKRIADMEKQMREMSEFNAKLKRDKIDALRDGVIDRQISEMGIVPEARDAARTLLLSATIIREDENGGVSFTQKFKDPKTKEELEDAPTAQTGALIVPKELQQARGGAGSGGSSPRIAGDPKSNDMVSKSVGSQKWYEDHRGETITAERAQHASTTPGAITTEAGTR